MNLQICYLKIDVSCEASINFQHISQNTMPTTEFAPCHRSPDNAIRKNHATKQVESVAPATQNEDGHVQSAAPATKTGTHLLKPHKTIFDTIQTRLNVTKCHACHAKRSNATVETSKSDLFCRTYHRHGHSDLARTVAKGCERLRTVERTHPQPPDPQSETGTLATHSGKPSTKTARAARIARWHVQDLITLRQLWIYWPKVVVFWLKNTTTWEWLCQLSGVAFQIWWNSNHTYNHQQQEVV